LACHLQIDADPDPFYHFDAVPDPTVVSFNLILINADPNPDPDPQQFPE
jgi:hypothetical protein